MSKFDLKSLKAVQYLPEFIASAGLIIIVVLEAMQAVSRYAFHYTFLFVDDVVVISFSWTAFAGAAAAYRRKMHYGLDVLSKIIPHKAKLYFGLAVQFVVMVLLGFLLYQSIILFNNAGSKILFTTKLSYKWIDSAVIYGFAMMFFYSVRFFVEDIRAIKGKEGKT